MALGSMGMSIIGMGIQLAIAYFFPQKVKGPRQENLKAQTSKYGEPAGARCYGTVRVPASVIWLKNNKVDEHKKKKRSKAMGPITIEYTYSADFAISFMWNGPVTGIIRLWADKKIVLDRSAATLEELIANGGIGKGIGDAKGATFTIYTGTETQEPDPDIEAAIGVGQVPAWPGLVYVVVKNFPLEDFGIRVPNFEAEIVCNGTETTPWVNPTGDVGGDCDIKGDRYASMDGTTLALNRIPDGALLWTATLPAASQGVHITERGDIAVASNTGGTVWFYDGLTGAIIQTLATYAFIADPWQQFADTTVDGTAWLFNAGFGYLVAMRNSGNGWEYVWVFDIDTSALNGPLTISAGPEYVYIIKQGGIGNPNVLRKVPWSTTGVSPYSDLSLSLTGNLLAASYDLDSDSVVVLTTSHLYTLEPDLSAILQSRTLGYTAGPNPLQIASKRMRSFDSRVMVKSTNNDFHEYNISDLSETLTVIAATTDWDQKAQTSYQYWGIAPDWSMAWVGGGAAGPRYWFLPRLGRSPVPLADVIEAECGYVGITPDVTGITKLIKGYSARETTSPRGIIEDLARTQFFDFAQMGTVLTFVMRSPTAAASISINDMGAADEDENENPRLIEEEYSDLRELPTRIAISYPAYGGDYRTGTQTMQSPDGLDDTRNVIEFSTPLVMADDEAAQSADILYNETREALNSFKFKISSKYLNRSPADVLNLPLDESRTVTAVITKMSGENIIEVEAHLRTMDYTSDAVGSPTPGDGTASLLGKANLAFLPIDGHLLRSVDDQDSFYWGVTRIDSGTFSSAMVYRSTDGGSEYSPWETVVSELVRGFALAALPTRPHPEAWDRASSFVVAVGNSRSLPASVTEALLLSNSSLNAFAVQSGTDWEYIRAATIVNSGNGTWTLSTLLRGCKGTDFAMAGHAAGDAVIYLDPNDLERPEEGDKDLDRIYVPVHSSTAFNSSLGRHFTNTSRGLRPWAPVAIQATRDGSGNITFIWNRRDRLGQDWPDDGPEDPPMSETAESYKVKIYNGVTLLRTITASSETAPYSAANQTTDFGSPQASVLTGVLQVSSTYGDGVERQATV